MKNVELEKMNNKPPRGRPFDQYKCFFIKDFQILPTWEGKYKNSIDALRNQARRTRRDDMETPASPAGGPTPVIQGAN